MDALRTERGSELVADRLPDLGNNLEDAIAGGDSLEDAAGRAGAVLRKVEAVDRQGRGRDGKSLPGERLPAEVIAAAFETAYAMLLPATFSPATEVTFTTAPPPARRIAGAAAFVQSQIPLTLTSMIRSHSSSGIPSRSFIATNFV